MQPMQHFHLRRKCIIVLLFFCLGGPQSPTTAAALSLGEYPNPLRGDQFAACKVSSPGPFCDAEEVLSRPERTELIQLLNAFPDQTKNDAGASGCKKKGVTAGVALSKKPLYYAGIDATGKEFNATGDAPFRLLNQWNLDNECRKAFLLVLPTEAVQYAQVAFFFSTPILRDELNHLFAVEHKAFQEKRWLEAIRAILGGIRQIVNGRHGTLAGENAKIDDSDDDTDNGHQQQQQSDHSDGAAAFAGGGVGAPPISIWVHFLFFLCTIFGSVALTLGILWTFRVRIFQSLRHGLPLIRFSRDNRPQAMDE